MNPVTAYISGRAPLPSEAELRETRDKYPWFSPARILLYCQSGVVDDRVRLTLATGRYASLLSAPGTEGSGATAADSDRLGAGKPEAGPDGAVTHMAGATGTEMAEAAELPDIAAGTGAGTLDIIDRFLATEPQKITPDDNISSEDKALDSATDDDEMVTEELAAIYLAQGASQRAREIYLKLSLLYPEKSVYFAEIIARIDAGKSE